MSEGGPVQRSRADVVIVGAGIAGGALAAHLAGSGVSVTLIEASTEYSDRVRGEGIMPWGVAAAKRIGAAGTLRNAGALAARTMINYANSRSTPTNEASPAKLDATVDGTGGGLTIRHPVACQALTDAAENAGANLHRGATELEIGGASMPTVRFRSGSTVHETSCRLIVAADGRGSTVRRASGIELRRNRGTHFVAGMLIDCGEHPLPAQMITARNNDHFLIYFAEPDQLCRVYLCGDASEIERFSGRDSETAFLDALRFDSVPGCERLRTARPAGPCAAIRADDSYTDKVAVAGVVLIGDAAGYASPITGQGLSLAFADASDVSAAILAGDLTTDAFETYRKRKQHRLDVVRYATEVTAAVSAERCNNRSRRIGHQQLLLANNDHFRHALEAEFTGPETIATGELPWDEIERIRTA